MSPRKKAAPKRAPAKEMECLCMGFGPQVTRILSEFGPDRARGHFRTARIEALKGLRSLIDHRIEALGKEGKRGTTIQVE
jgi:hypothetical protein